MGKNGPHAKHKLKVRSFTLDDDTHLAVEQSASVAEKRGKRTRLKLSSFTPATSSANLHSASVARTLPTAKHKSAANGRFKVHNARGVSGVAVPNVPINDPRSTEDLLDDWLAPCNDLGWDEGYVNSFVEKDIPPPKNDPEVPVKPAQTGKGVSSLILLTLNP